MELYGEKDYQNTKRMLLIRTAVLILILAALVVLVVLFTGVWRNSTLCMAACGVGAAVAMFYASMKVKPWFHYWRYQVDIVNGRAHDMDCAFVSVSEGERMSDGVAFHEFIVALDGEQGADNERMLFWDSDKQIPALKPGQKMHIRAFGNYIIALEAEGIKRRLA